MVPQAVRHVFALFLESDHCILVGFDASFNDVKHVYGIPEHAAHLALHPTQ